MEDENGKLWGLVIDSIRAARKDLRASELAVEQLRPTGAPFVARLVESFEPITVGLREMSDAAIRRDDVSTVLLKLTGLRSSLGTLEQSLLNSIRQGNGSELYRYWLTRAELCARSVSIFVEMSINDLDRVVALSKQEAE